MPNSGKNVPEPFFITTPIYYVNARPHLGHAYTTLVADVISRFEAMRDRAVFFLTGTDEHGDKIVRAAKHENMSPRTYVDRISQLFRDLWPKLNIHPNAFLRTTDSAHIAVVERILQRIYDAGDIYFSEYEGLYCFGCERFYTERELIGGKCPDHQAEPERIREANYFFRMSRYQQWLIDHIQANPDFVRPERYKNEVLAFLREPLEDLCISRPKSRLMWGITLPFDREYVTYVWFDALLNYVSALGYPDGEAFRTFWPEAQHIVAKDILKPHGIYWPIMLKAAGIPIYRHLNVHGYWNVDSGKMSKSLGNVIDPVALAERYGLDQLRYFLMREMSFGLDASFGEEMIVTRINADLANDLGNLLSRVITMTHKYFAGVVPAADIEVERRMQIGLQAEAWRTIADYEAAMQGFAFHKALIAVWEFVGSLNKFIDVTAPWVLAKSTASRPELEAVMYNLLEGLRVIAGLVAPVMPEAAATMQRHLGLAPSAQECRLDRLKCWKSLTPGTSLPKAKTLFPRIAEPKEPSPASVPERAAAESAQLPDLKPEIAYEDFSRLDLRVATVLKAEPIAKARKLLQLEIDAGFERRTIVAGIAGSYAPEDLVGKQVVIVANLKPAKLMGVLSQGMLLAATDGSASSVLTVTRAVQPGAPVR